MGGRNLAVVAWGEKPEAAIKNIASRLGAKLLTIAGTDDTCFAWFRRTTRSISSDDDPKLIELPANTQIVCGQYANDVAGFRTSHAQAGLAYRAGRV